jgi:hypothetical protein
VGTRDDSNQFDETGKESIKQSGSKTRRAGRNSLSNCLLFKFKLLLSLILLSYFIICLIKKYIIISYISILFNNKTKYIFLKSQ